MDGMFYEHELEDAATLIRDAMRVHEERRFTDTEFAEYHAMMARRAKHLLEIIKPKHYTQH